MLAEFTVYAQGEEKDKREPLHSGGKVMNKDFFGDSLLSFFLLGRVCPFYQSIHALESFFLFFSMNKGLFFC